MKLSPDASRHYLNAMGIESWEPRSKDPGGDVTAAPQQLDSVAGVPFAGQLDPAVFLQGLAQSPVTITTTGQQNSLLVLLEAPVLSAAGAELLSSMFKAINVDLSMQSLGYLGQPMIDDKGPQGDATMPPLLSALAGVTHPSMIIVMLDLQADIDSLAAHRSSLHSVVWASAPVAITLHPRVLLENPACKRHAWEDLKQVKAALNG